MELEQGKNADFWRDMTIITEDEIAKLRKLEASGKGPGNAGRATGDTPGCALGEAPLGLVGAPWAGWLHRRGLGFLSGVSLPGPVCEPPGGSTRQRGQRVLSEALSRWRAGSPKQRQWLPLNSCLALGFPRSGVCGFSVWVSSFRQRLCPFENRT